MENTKQKNRGNILISNVACDRVFHEKSSEDFFRQRTQVKLTSQKSGLVYCFLLILACPMLFFSQLKQQTTNNKQQTTNNKQQTTNNKQQTTNRT